MTPAAYAYDIRVVQFKRKSSKNARVIKLMTSYTKTISMIHTSHTLYILFSSPSPSSFLPHRTRPGWTPGKVRERSSSIAHRNRHASCGAAAPRPSRGGGCGRRGVPPAAASAAAAAAAAAVAAGPGLGIRRRPPACAGDGCAGEDDGDGCDGEDGRASAAPAQIVDGLRRRGRRRHVSPPAPARRRPHAPAHSAHTPPRSGAFPAFATWACWRTSMRERPP